MVPLVAFQTGGRGPYASLDAHLCVYTIERRVGITKDLKFFLILCSKGIIYNLRETLTGLKENCHHSLKSVFCYI